MSETTNYTIRKNIKETTQAIKTNLATVVSSILVAFLLSLGVIFVFTLMVGASLLSGISGSFSPSSFGIGFIVTLVLVSLAFSLISALLSIFISLSVDDGASGNKTSMNNVFVRSQKVLWRVIKTEILFVAVVFGPLVLLAAVSITQLANSRSFEGVAAYGGLSFLLSIFGLVWSIIAVLRYCLAPIVAIFEPKLAVRQTLGRSQELLKNGGQWFIFKLALLYLLVIIILSMFTADNTYQSYQRSENPVLNVVSTVLAIFVTGMAVLLYRNRVFVKNQTKS